MTASSSIQPARREHLAAICAINAESIPGVASLTMPEVLEMLETASLVLVALWSVEVVGYVIAYASDAAYAGEEFVWFRSRKGNFLYIDQVAVASAHRGRGVGAALYEAAETFALSGGVDELTCEVNLDPPNQRSLRFHASRGFFEVGRLHTTDGRYVALLRKRIADRA